MRNNFGGNSRMTPYGGGNSGGGYGKRTKRDERISLLDEIFLLINRWR